MNRAVMLPLLVAAGGFLPGMAPVVLAQVTFETRALTGTDGPLGPGLGAGVSFRGFDVPTLNGAGHSAFSGSLTGAGVSLANQDGVWSEGGGAGLALIARMGNPAPGTGAGVNFIGFNSPVLNDAGQAAFRGYITGVGVTGSNNQGVWTEGGGSGLTLVARTDTQAPGTAAGVKFLDLEKPVFNDAGQAAFFADLTGAGVISSVNDSGFWSEGGGSGLTLVARTGNQAPATDPGVNFSRFRSIGVASPPLNHAGQTAFFGGLAGAGVTGLNDGGIWSGGGGSSLALVARVGDQAPGLAPGVNFSTRTFGSPALNRAGQTAFSGGLIDNNGGNNGRGIWSEGGGAGLALVARTGSQAPGTDVNFSSFGSLVLNDAGQVAFSGNITGVGVTSSNNNGIWSEGGGSGLALVARTGSQAPGTPGGVNFGSFGSNGGTPLVLNGAGQTAFLGNLTGAGVNGSNGTGIWATDADGQLQMIVREGELFDVSNDPLSQDLRLISNLSLITGSGGEDGRAASFNDAGQLAFLARFTDGSSGIFVANTVPVPEPGTLALLGLGGLMVGARRLHRTFRCGRDSTGCRDNVVA